MENVFLSVIIPAFNVENYILKTLDSLKGQTYKEFEIIIINDGSTDKTKEVVERFQEENKLNLEIISQVNKGVSAARNKGLEIAKGEYIYFLDGDDYIEKNTFEEIKKIIEIEKVETVIFESDIILKNKVLKFGLSKPSGRYRFWEILNALVIKENYITMCSVIFKKSIIEGKKIKFENGKFAEDTEFILKYLIDEKKELFFLNMVLFHYVERNNSACGTFNLEKLNDMYKSFSRVKDRLKQFSKLEKNSMYKKIENILIPFSVIDGIIKLYMSSKTEYKKKELFLLIKQILNKNPNIIILNYIVFLFLKNKYKIPMGLILFYIKPKLYKVYLKRIKGVM